MHSHHDSGGHKLPGCPPGPPLALPCRALHQLTNDTLWPLLGQKYSAEGGSNSLISCVPKAEHYEEAHLATKVRKLDTVLPIKAIAKTYKEVGAAPWLEREGLVSTLKNSKAGRREDHTNAAHPALSSLLLVAGMQPWLMLQP